MTRRAQPSRWRRRWFWTVAALSVAGVVACRRSAPPPNLLLITVDTLRADRLGCYGYAAAATPHLDRLARTGLRFERAATVTPLTLPAHASLMTGRDPAAHGVRDNGGFYLEDDALTLAEVLAESGYRTGGFVGAFVLDSRWGIAQGFAHFFDDFDLSEHADALGLDAIQRPGGEVVDRALDWLAADRSLPFFAWVHLYDPHTPYEAPEPHRSRFPATLSGAYDAEVAAADAQVGRLLSALEGSGRLADTVVIAVADHGEMLGEHGEATHGFFLYEAAVRIPMLLAGPGVPSGVVDNQVRIVDLMPTALSLLGVPPPPLQGVDLLPLARGERRRLAAHSESYFPRYHYGWSELHAIQDGRYKLIQAPRRELYDLWEDPGEAINLATIEVDRADRMEAALEAMLAEESRPVASTPQPVDPAVAERLRALGYLGGGSQRHLEEGVERGDPKDKIVLYNLLKQATAASVEGELDTAIERARRVLAEDPEVVEAYLLLGNFERKAGRLEEAAAAYSEALSRDSEHQEALYNLAITYKAEGKLEEALAGLERAAALDPRNGQVLWQQADVEMRRGRLPAAEAVLLRALALDLDRPRFLQKLAECYLEMARPEEAVDRLRAALTESPSLRGARFHLGLAYEELGRLAEAMEAYRGELEAHDGAHRASFNLGRLLLDAGRTAEAVGYLRRSVGDQPEFGTGYLYLAKALLDLGRLDEAREAAETGLTRRPEAAIAPLGHYVLADVFNRTGRPEAAAREVAAARRLEAEEGSS